MPVPQSPTSPLERLGAFTVRRSRWVIAVAVLGTLLAGVIGSGAMGALVLSRFEVPGSESDRAEAVLADEFGAGSPNLVLLVTARRGTVDDPAVASAGERITRELGRRPGVAQAWSYWTEDADRTLRGAAGRQAIVLARVAGDATTARARIAELAPELDRDTDLVLVDTGGSDLLFGDVGAQARQDFLRAELIIVPLVLVLLAVLYRRVRLALITLGIGVFAMLTTLAALRGIAAVTDVSTFAANLTLVMGLALGVDYSLFVVARYRERLAAGAPVPAAVGFAVRTAGRTVIFSGITVAASLSTLLLVPFPFLRSFGYAGVLVVLSTMVGALVILPAALALLGRRAAARPARRAARTTARAGRGWSRLINGVVGRPVLTGGAALVILLVLSAPLLGLRFGLPDERVLPADTPSRVTHEQIRAGFAAEATDAVHLVSDGATAGQPAVAGYAAELSALDGVAQVDSAAGRFAGGSLVATPAAGPTRFSTLDRDWLTVVPTQQAMAGDVAGFIAGIRAVPAPFPVMITGYPAELTDFRDALADRLPLVGGLILALTFAILFLLTGSLLLPLKATVLNLLSMSVMLGVTVWVFQHGNLSGLLGFTATGAIEPSIPILMFCVAYGLSMDYEVFLTARIKEEYDHGRDNTAAVAAGIRSSAPLVTAAAGILALSFATYLSGGVVFLKMLGLGMAVAVLIDATLIRGVLLPAFMQLAGRANWWAPPLLRRIHRRFGLTETTAAPVAGEPQVAAKVRPAPADRTGAGRAERVQALLKKKA